jgi:hypothetical protein
MCDKRSIMTHNQLVKLLPQQSQVLLSELSVTVPVLCWFKFCIGCGLTLFEVKETRAQTLLHQ